MGYTATIAVPGIPVRYPYGYPYYGARNTGRFSVSPTRLATDASVADRVSFVLGDVVEGPLPEGEFDAIVVAYPQLSAAGRRAALRLAAGALAPGATLLVVAHDSTNLIHGVGGPPDPAVLYTPQDVLADLDDLPNLTIQAAERRHRLPDLAGRRNVGI